MPRPAPFSDNDFDKLRLYLDKQLSALHHRLDHQVFLQLPMLSVEPAKVFEGLIVFADGTEWDPGLGKGIYAYYDATWNKLG